jgi:hypothetical protein
LSHKVIFFLLFVVFLFIPNKLILILTFLIAYSKEYASVSAYGELDGISVATIHWYCYVTGITLRLTGVHTTLQLCQCNSKNSPKISEYCKLSSACCKLTLEVAPIALYIAKIKFYICNFNRRKLYRSNS